MGIKVRTYLTGYEVWRGPSPIDGQPIVAILVKTRKNPKTGPGWTLYILRRDIDPIRAIAEGKDKSICGSCIHRLGDRTCYVQFWKAPHGMYQKFKRGGYPRRTSAWIALLIIDAYVRLGGYGDPGALPLPLLKEIVPLSRTWTGYTHLWKMISRYYRELLMASVESAKEKTRANAMGYRTFRVGNHVDEMLPDECLCPASEAGGFKATCSTCGLCAGTSITARNVFIPVHGSASGKFTKEIFAEKTGRISLV